MIHRRVRRSKAKSAFTLIELLVVLGIIGVLVGLLLPAVQAAREAARRAECAAHLKSLMQAVHSFESARGGFPPSQYWKGDKWEDQYVGIFSTQCLLLEHIGMNNLYNSINFDLPATYTTWLEIFHRTAASHAVNGFLCPSEPRARFGDYAANSYRVSVGLGERTRPPSLGWINSGAFVPDDGTFRVLSLGEFRDGLSQTLAISEKPVGSGPGGVAHPFRDWGLVPSGSPTSYTADDWLSACAKLNKDAPWSLRAGASWMLPEVAHTTFFTSAPPNSRVADCSEHELFAQSGIFAARSYHPGGVNAAMADGSVRWFGSGVSLQTWRALGTRAGGEVIAAE